MNFYSLMYTWLMEPQQLSTPISIKLVSIILALVGLGAAIISLPAAWFIMISLSLSSTKVPASGLLFLISPALLLVCGIWLVILSMRLWRLRRKALNQTVFILGLCSLAFIFSQILSAAFVLILPLILLNLLIISILWSKRKIFVIE